MNGRGWCDIAYNFLVDKYGQIFEGRDRRHQPTCSRIGLRHQLGQRADDGRLADGQPRQGAAQHRDEGRHGQARRLAGRHVLPGSGQGWSQHRRQVAAAHLRSPQRRRARPAPASTATPGSTPRADSATASPTTSSQYRSEIKSAAWRLDGLRQTVTGPVEAGEIGSATWRQTAFTKYDFFWRSGYRLPTT